MLDVVEISHLEVAFPCDVLQKHKAVDTSQTFSSSFAITTVSFFSPVAVV